MHPGPISAVFSKRINRFRLIPGTFERNLPARRRPSRWRMRAVGVRVLRGTPTRIAASRPEFAAAHLEFVTAHLEIPPG
jgi:hypothetical protein